MSDRDSTSQLTASQAKSHREPAVLDSYPTVGSDSSSTTGK